MKKYSEMKKEAEFLREAVPGVDVANGKFTTEDATRLLKAKLDFKKAIEENRIKAVRETLARPGAREFLINGILNSQGVTPLFMSVFKGHYEISELLINTGASISIEMIGMAIQEGHRNITKLLLDSPSKLDVNTPLQDQSTLLMFAAKFGDLSAVQQLIRKGACLEARNMWESCALTFAANHGNVDIVEYLYSLYTNVDLRKEDAELALSMGTASNRPRVAEYLISQGVSLHAIRCYKKTNETRKILDEVVEEDGSLRTDRMAAALSIINKVKEQSDFMRREFENKIDNAIKTFNIPRDLSVLCASYLPTKETFTHVEKPVSFWHTLHKSYGEYFAKLSLDPNFIIQNKSSREQVEFLSQIRKMAENRYSHQVRWTSEKLVIENSVLFLQIVYDIANRSLDRKSAVDYSAAVNVLIRDLIMPALIESWDIPKLTSEFLKLKSRMNRNTLPDNYQQLFTIKELRDFSNDEIKGIQSFIKENHTLLFNLLAATLQQYINHYYMPRSTNTILVNTSPTSSTRSSSRQAR